MFTLLTLEQAPQFDSKQLFDINISNLLVEEGLTLKQLCKGLTQICDSHPTFYIKESDQDRLYQKITSLSLYKENPLHGLDSVTLPHFVASLSRFEPPSINFSLNKLTQYTTERIGTICKEFNLSQISTILNYLPSLPNTRDTALILINYFPSLIKARQNEKTLSPEEIAFIFKELLNIGQIYNGDSISEIFNELAWHLEVNNGNGISVNPNQLAYTFFGLQINPHSDSTIRLAKALLPQFKQLTKEKKWCHGRELCMLMEGVKDMPSNETTLAIWKEVIVHIETLQEQREIVPSQFLAPLLATLAHIQTDDVVAQDTVNRLLLALKRHIDKQAKPFTLLLINKALPGLHNLSHLFAAHDIINLFTARLQLPRMNKPKAIELSDWINNAQSYLSQYLSPSAPAEAQSAARAFLQKAIEVFKPIVSINLETILDHSDSYSPRTHTTGSDHSLSEEEAHQDELAHPMHH